MHLISKFNKEVRFLLCVIDLFGKYTWIVTLKDKKENRTVKKENQTKYVYTKGVSFIKDQ